MFIYLTLHTLILMHTTTAANYNTLERVHSLIKCDCFFFMLMLVFKVKHLKSCRVCLNHFNPVIVTLLLQLNRFSVFNPFESNVNKSNNVSGRRRIVFMLIVDEVVLWITT